MQITLISQCEKNALSRTRMVLDAFTERIGDNAWQTLITKEGLDALHTELRKTASKSTAVSCHWQRSRTRSQLLWIVGKKHEFNASGNVPVNETDQELTQFIDMKQNSILYANTQKQSLKEHLFGVAYLASDLIERLIPDSESNKKTLKEAAYIAGLWHDLGKIDPQFQNWITTKRIKKKIEDVDANGVHIDAPAKFSFSKHPRHNEISLILFEKLFACSKPHSFKHLVAHAILWHHAKPYRKDNKFERITEIQDVFKASLNGEEGLNSLLKQATGLLKSANSLSPDNFLKPDSFEEVNAFFLRELPAYKLYDGCEDNLVNYHNSHYTTKIEGFFFDPIHS